MNKKKPLCKKKNYFKEEAEDIVLTVTSTAIRKLVSYTR